MLLENKIPTKSSIDPKDSSSLKISFDLKRHRTESVQIQRRFPFIITIPNASTMILYDPTKILINLNSCIAPKKIPVKTMKISIDPMKIPFYSMNISMDFNDSARSNKDFDWFKKASISLTTSQTPIQRRFRFIIKSPIALTMILFDPRKILINRNFSDRKKDSDRLKKIPIDPMKISIDLFSLFLKKDPETEMR